MLQSTRELYLTFSLGLPLEWAPGKLRIWELFKIMVLQDINVIWSKSFLPVGCTNAREIRQTACGTAGASQPVPGKSPSACPHTPPGIQEATAGGSLFKITDGSRLSLLRFCFVQRQNRPGTWLSKKH